ncbi:hypothetical protein TPA0908_39320 [Micromonospora sp. AKA38]|nr:hypothetical protein TPA0908_39320 [Micromonospora sp. AKA38]
MKTPPHSAEDRVRRFPRLLILAALLGASAVAAYVGDTSPVEAGTQALRDSCPDWACGQNHNQVLL